MLKFKHKSGEGRQQRNIWRRKNDKELVNYALWVVRSEAREVFRQQNGQKGRGRGGGRWWRWWRLFSITCDRCSNEIISIPVLPCLWYLLSSTSWSSPAELECTAQQSGLVRLENAIWIKVLKYCNLAYFGWNTLRLSPQRPCGVRQEENCNLWSWEKPGRSWERTDPPVSGV